MTSLTAKINDPGEELLRVPSWMPCFPPRLLKSILQKPQLSHSHWQGQHNPL